ncbi:hypothetical protein L9F63_016857, partial [Diploptera punctata]
FLLCSDIVNKVFSVTRFGWSVLQSIFNYVIDDNFNANIRITRQSLSLVHTITHRITVVTTVISMVMTSMTCVKVRVLMPAPWTY